MQLNEVSEVDFTIKHMAWGNHNLSLLIADEKGNLRILKFKDNLVMEDKKNMPKAINLFNEDCKVSGFIYDEPHIVATNDKGMILF